MALVLRSEGINRKGAKYAKEEKERINLEPGLPIKINAIDQ